jgi:hypothetical protein
MYACLRLAASSFQCHAMLLLVPTNSMEYIPQSSYVRGIMWLTARKLYLERREEV